jgi:hypothetical protein
MFNLFLYLIKKDRKDIKIITSLDGEIPIKPCKVNDVKRLELPPPITQAAEQIIKSHHMQWDAWIESANSIQDLQKSLKRRGFYYFPMKPSHALILSEVENNSSLIWNRSVTSLPLKRLSR